MQLYTRQVIREIEKKYNFKVSKSLGQNFIADKNILDAIVDGADVGENDLVIEIGPGLGVLTSAVAERARRVVAIEIDSHLLPILDMTLAGHDNTEVVNADILKTNLGDLIRKEKDADPGIEQVKVIGNLPYYITTPIIMKLLKEELPIESITIMMQKEVADRIEASPGSKTYGVLSLSVQYYCEVEKVIDVPKDVFAPPPKVDSEVLRLTLRDEKPVHPMDPDAFFGCIKSGFRMRRKTMLNCMAGFDGSTKEQVHERLEEAGIASNRRAETLSMEEFSALADVFVKHREEK